jgi:hypothetical protein
MQIIVRDKAILPIVLNLVYDGACAAEKGIS